MKLSYGGETGVKSMTGDEWVVARLATCRGWTTSHLNTRGVEPSEAPEVPEVGPTNSQPGRAADSRFSEMPDSFRRRRRRHQLPS